MLNRDLAAVWLRAGRGMSSHERSAATCGRKTPASEQVRRCTRSSCDREHEPADAAVALLRCTSQEYFQLDGVVAL